jgi:hypothetical protein
MIGAASCTQAKQHAAREDNGRRRKMYTGETTGRPRGQKKRALLLIAALALVPVARLLPPTPSAEAPASRLPQRLGAQEFWELSTTLSEPDGYFRSNNLVSNELFMQRVIPDLVRTVRPGGAYLGVGPEQNFTYIAAVKPGIAFIVDIRRGNLRLHLMYKALFELSSDRGEFVSRLFSMKRPGGLGRRSTVQEIFAAYADPQLRSEDLYKQNVIAIREFFAKNRNLNLMADDLRGIEEVYHEFYTQGLDIHYEIMPGSNGSFPTYAEMMQATDSGAVARGFLATEENFALVRELHSRNLIVPVVGNFAGPKAIRAIGRYLRSQNALVSAFYVSNVEQYLGREGGQDEFCASAATLPLDESSVFIRSERRGFGPRNFRSSGGPPGNFSSQLHNIRNEVKGCTWALR